MAREPTAFSLEVEALNESLSQAVGRFSPSEVREIVKCIFVGGNYRSLTEKPTREAISVYQAWILRTCHRAHAQFAEAWCGELLRITGRRRAVAEEKWLRLWIMGVTSETVQNLGLRSADYEEYLARARASRSGALGSITWSPTTIDLTTAGMSGVMP